MASKSSLENKTLRETDFLYRHEACVVGVKRKGIGICRYSYENFKIKAGDLLLVEGPASRHSTYRSHYDFQLAYVVPGSKPPRLTSMKDIIRQVIAVLLFLVMILLSIFGTLDIGIAAFFLSLIFVLNKTLTLSEAKAASNPDIYIILAASIGLATGLTNSGAMNKLGQGLLTAGEKAGTGLVIGLIYICTVVLSLVLSTSATAIIMMPIAFQAAEATGMSQKLFIFVIILAASQGFSTPFSYQTNLMVWRPGGYKFCDFIVVGIPLNVILLVLGTVLCYYIYGEAAA